MQQSGLSPVHRFIIVIVVAHHCCLVMIQRVQDQGGRGWFRCPQPAGLYILLEPPTCLDRMVLERFGVVDFTEIQNLAEINVLFINCY